jgi:DivIVA domain-containing protein
MVGDVLLLTVGVRMARLVVVAMHPSARIAPGTLADAWNADREASAAGRAQVEAADVLPDLQEWVVIPLAVNLASSAGYDLLKRLILSLRDDTSDASSVEITNFPVGDVNFVVVVAFVDDSQPPPAPPAPGSSAVEMAEWIQQAEFHTTDLPPGYDESEVDDFLDGVRETFLGLREPPLTAEDVRNIQFKTTAYTEGEFVEVLQQASQDAAASGDDPGDLAIERLQRPGYDIEDVDAFLDQVELALESWATPAPPRD